MRGVAIPTLLQAKAWSERARVQAEPAPSPASDLWRLTGALAAPLLVTCLLLLAAA